MKEKSPLYIRKMVELDIDPKYYYDRWTSMDETLEFGPIVFMQFDYEWIVYQSALNGYFWDIPGYWDMLF
jgi:hypothetical protein